jgi:hypothetical protein
MRRVPRRLRAFLVGFTVIAGCGGGGPELAPSSSVDIIVAQGRPDSVIVGPQGRTAQFLVHCSTSHFAPDDPIVHPGHEGASHLHVFFGNSAVTATSAYDELLGAETSCEQRLDTASYWAPALIRSGRVVEPTQLVAYYRPGPGIDPTALVAYPPGLMLIAGDPDATSPQPLEIASWSCGAGVLRSPRPLTCPDGAPVRQHITFPDCWDGSRLDSSTHREHAVYSANGECPSTHPVPVPQLTLAISYPVSGDPSDLVLSSGSVYGLHADFWNVWDQDKLEAEVRHCLHRALVCDVTS